MQRRSLESTKEVLGVVGLLRIRSSLCDKSMGNWEHNIEVNWLFIDFKSAYDSIFREKIWNEMHKMGFPKKLCNICEIFAKIEILNSLNEEFKILEGLRQGDAILPILYNIVLEIAVRKFKIMTTGTIFHKCTQILAYAHIIGWELTVEIYVIFSL